MNPEDTQQVRALTRDGVARCVGYHLLDLPAPFVLNTQSRTEVDGIEIVVTPQSRTDFEAMLRQRKSRYAAMTLPSSAYPYVRASMPIGGSAAGIVFDRNELDASSMRGGRILELHGWKDGYAIDMRVKATDGSFPELQNIAFWREQGSDVPQQLTRLRGMYDRVQGRADTEVPTGPGLCFAHGFLAGPPSETAWVDMYHHLDGSRDVAFSYHQLSDLAQDDSLLERGDAIRRALANVEGRTLRKGASAARIPGAQEWLTSQATQDGTRRYQHFTLETNATQASATTPVFVMDLDVGVEIPGPELTLDEAALKPALSATTFNEAQTLAIWDAVVPTLRVRPGAF